MEQTWSDRQSSECNGHGKNGIYMTDSRETKQYTAKEIE